MESKYTMRNGDKLNIRYDDVMWIENIAEENEELPNPMQLKRKLKVLKCKYDENAMAIAKENYYKAEQNYNIKPTKLNRILADMAKKKLEKLNELRNQMIITRKALKQLKMLGKLTDEVVGEDKWIDEELKDF